MAEPNGFPPLALPFNIGHAPEHAARSRPTMRQFLNAAVPIATTRWIVMPDAKVALSLRDRRRDGKTAR